MYEGHKCTQEHPENGHFVEATVIVGHPGSLCPYDLGDPS